MPVATDLAFYQAGTVLPGGAAGTGYWPGGPIVDDVSLTGCSITSGTPTLNATSANFTAAMVGRMITVNGAGAGGAVLDTKILTYVSASQVTLLNNAGTTVASAGTGKVVGEMPTGTQILGQIPASNLWSKTTLYSCIYLRNVHASRTYNSIYVGLARGAGNQNTTVDIALGGAINTPAATRTNTQLSTSPGAFTYAKFLNVPDLSPGSYQTIWIKQVPLYSTLGAVTTTEAGITLSWSAKY